MAEINIKTSKKAIPKIYAYTTPGISYHDGYTKVGYTEQAVEDRVRQQTHTAGIKAKIEWSGIAMYDDGSGYFTDRELHAYMRQRGIRQPQDDNNEYFDPSDENEWFKVSPKKSNDLYYEYRKNKGISSEDDIDVQEISNYCLRDEQAQAVSDTISYIHDNPNGEYLWNAKPRFGKTLSVYDLVKKICAKKVLILTNYPVIANSWLSDYKDFVGRQSGLVFVSEVDGIKDDPLVMSYEDYAEDNKERIKDSLDEMGIIEFVSLQNLKGSQYFSTRGDSIDKLKEVSVIKWDLLVLDEAHIGVDTYKTDIALDHINRKFTLHLSGTPFKALADGKFDTNIFNWTYADEQERKADWDESKGENPYAALPKLNMFTYQMSGIIEDKVKRGADLGEDTTEYAFDLNEFFSTDENGRFKYNEDVNKFLNALTTQEKFPFSTPALRDELKHTLWILDRVASAKALFAKLEKHPVFSQYKIILAAGDGRTDDDEETKKSFDKVVESIEKYDKTITLSVGQLTTGVTIPQWTAVLMLSNMKSPALYMQAAFRAQNPCAFEENGEFLRKTNAYVFDFDPARTLMIYDDFANDLISETSGGKGDSDTRKEHVRKLLNFFPVIGEDSDGKMIELDAEKVLSIPRKIKCQEVVRRGFMSNFLFQNISNVFGAPQAVIDILNKMESVSEPKAKSPIPDNPGDGLDINSDGEIEVPEEKVIGTAASLFGDKVYDDISEKFSEAVSNATPKEPDETEKKLDELKKALKEQVTAPLIDKAKEKVGNELSQSAKKEIERKIESSTDKELNKTFGDYKINQNIIKKEYEDKLDTVMTSKEREQIDLDYENKKKEIDERLKSTLVKVADEIIEHAGNTVAEVLETNREEKKANTVKDSIRDHLRGFSRTIPSFIMAYGSDNEITLSNFDTIVPDDVFKDVTSITIEEFKFLRDGGDRPDSDGNMQHFEGHLFDPVVFDDSVKEFMSLRVKLSDYFDESQTEDIFDYIPPQKTNQIFTPKRVVKEMVDDLEKENPGCFDDPDHTFADLYMKSGMYITEIVKRIYQSPKMKELFPSDDERLRHIFEHQVYGCAPTEIIYRICLSYILGFSDEVKIEKHNIRLLDTLKYAQEGTMEEKLREVFPEAGADE